MLETVWCLSPDVKSDPCHLLHLGYLRTFLLISWEITYVICGVWKHNYVAKNSRDGFNLVEKIKRRGTSLSRLLLGVSLIYFFHFSSFALTIMGNARISWYFQLILWAKYLFLDNQWILFAITNNLLIFIYWLLLGVNYSILFLMLQKLNHLLLDLKISFYLNIESWICHE